MANDEMRAREIGRRFGFATGGLVENAIAAALQAEYGRGKREAAGKCAEIATAERVNADETGSFSDLAYNQACGDIAAEIRAAFGMDETTGEAVSR